MFIGYCMLWWCQDGKMLNNVKLNLFLLWNKHHTFLILNVQNIVKVSYCKTLICLKRKTLSKLHILQSRHFCLQRCIILLLLCSLIYLLFSKDLWLFTHPHAVPKLCMTFFLRTQKMKLWRIIWLLFSVQL